MLKAMPDKKESLLAGYFKHIISHKKENKRIVALIL